MSAAFEGLLGRLATATERGERVWVGDDLQTRHVAGELSFWELRSADSPIQLSAEMMQEMSAYLGRAGRYLDEDCWPPEMDQSNVAVADEAPTENPDVAWAHHWVRDGVAVACFGLRRRGVFRTTSTAGFADVHWVGDEPGHRAFFRAAINVERNTEASLERFAAHAFPDVHFLKGVWRGLRDFEGGYGRVRDKLRTILATLDDYGAWIFSAPPPAVSRNDAAGPHGVAPGDQLIQRRFASHLQDVSPEKPNVRDWQNCREAREREVGGRTLYLEWHVKLEPHINRVHIHAPVAESRQRVIVGIFHAHLPLPGDD